VSTGVHGALDGLGQNATFSHAVHRCNLRLGEVRPERHVAKEGMAQVNKYFFTHDFSPFSHSLIEVQIVDVGFSMWHASFSYAQSQGIFTTQNNSRFSSI
jgi:hypothetical protein